MNQIHPGLVLQNRIYCGEIVHKGKAFPGEHQATVDEELWQKVQNHLEANRVARRDGDNAIEPSLLTGLVFDTQGELMTPTHAVKKGTRYRYYVSRRLITGGGGGKAPDLPHGQRIPAPNLEALVTDQLRSLFANPVEIANAVSGDVGDAPMQKRLRDAAAALCARWESIPREGLLELMRSVLARTQVHSDRVDLEVGSAALVQTLLNESGGEGIGIGGETSTPPADRAEMRFIKLSIPARLKRAGMEMKFVIDGPRASAPADASLVRLLLRARNIGGRLLKSGAPTLEEIARDEGIVPSYATRLVRLTFLAPDIVAAILAGKQPPELTARRLMGDTRLPLDWREQRAELGFV